MIMRRIEGDVQRKGQRERCPRARIARPPPSHIEALALNVSFYALLIGIVLAAVDAVVVVVTVWGRVGVYACAVPFWVTAAACAA